MTARRSYTREDALTPELRLIGWSRFQQADRLALPPHHHGSAFEIHYLIHGRMDVVVGGETHSLRAGHVFVTRPNEIHGGVGNVLQQCEFYWTQIEPLRMSRSLGDLLEECASRRSFHGPPKIGGIMAEILVHHDEPQRHSPLACKALLELLLVELAHSNRPDYQSYTEPVEKCIGFLRSDLAKPLTFAQIAKRMGVSASFLAQRFRDEVGESPGKWFLHERLDHACKRLMDGISTRKIASELGYSSAQNFATTFRREMGLTPSEFRQFVQSHVAEADLPPTAPEFD